MWICCLCFQRQIRPTENPASLVTYSFNVILCFMWCPRNNLNNSSSFLLKQSLPIKSIQNNTKSGIIFPFYQSLNYNEPEKCPRQKTNRHPRHNSNLNDSLFYFISLYFISSTFPLNQTIQINSPFYQSLKLYCTRKTPEDKNRIM